MPWNNGTQGLVPTFQVKINGAVPPHPALADMLSATVYEDVTAPGMFTLHMINWDMVHLNVTWSDEELFAEGNEVELQMGYVDLLEQLIVGEITGLEPEFCADDVPTLTVRGYDRGHRLLRGRKTRSFSQMKDSEIAGQVANDLGLTPQVEDSGVILEYVLQHNQTDMEFLQDRAWRIGYEVIVADKTLYFHPHQITTAEVLTLARDEDLLEFYPRLTTMAQAGQVTVRGWNPIEKEKVVGHAGAGDETTTMSGATSGPAATANAFGQATMTSVDRPVFSQAEADQIALGRFNEMALGYITGEGMCVGRTDLRAGTTIKLEGLGKRFSGLYYVTSTTHTYSPTQGYQTAFHARRNAT